MLRCPTPRPDSRPSPSLARAQSRHALGALARRAAVLGLACLASGCGDDPAEPPRIVLRSTEAAVIVGLDPFALTIVDASGRQVLASVPAGPPSFPPPTVTKPGYGGPGATVDTPDFVAQVLPGWDGYSANEAPWRLATRARLVTSTSRSATLALAGDGIEIDLSVDVEGARVRLEASARGAGLNKSTMSFRSGPDEHFFGLGERFATLDHRGWSLYSWAEEGGLGGGEDVPPGPTNPLPSGPSMTYFPVPFFLSSRGYGMHLDTTFRTEVHFASETPDAWRFAVNAPRWAATIYVHADPLATLADYTEDTGRPPVPAPWVFGPRRRVSLGDQALGMPEPDAMRARDIAVTGIDDAVHFLPALSQLGREEELAAWTADLHAAGYKVMAYNNPYVAQNDEAAAADYAYGVDNGFFIVNDEGEVALTEFISGKLLTIATIDLTNPGAVAWFSDLLRRTLALGYDGWMHDFGEYVPRNAVLFDGRRGDEVHNEFPVLSAKAAHDLLEAERPGDYLFFVRSGYSGTQRWVPAVWGGDAEATFDETQGLPSAVRGGLNLSMSGVPYWGSDMTGFKCITDAPRDKDVFLRWVALGAVSPIMMEQNACSNPIGKKEKWKLWNDEETIEVYAKHARLHTRLMPYFLALAEQAHASGRPITLHPFLIHPEDPATYAIDDAFWVGPSLFAAPVVRRGQTERETWLPPGRWVDLEDRRVYDGGAIVTVPAPLAKLPLFLRAGSLVPLLDPTIDTLAPAEDPEVVTLEDVADRLDVVVALGPGDRASMRLADGTELVAERLAADLGDGGLVDVAESELADCSSCKHASSDGDVERLRVNGEPTSSESIEVHDVRLSHEGGPARRIRWDVLRL